MDAIFIMALFNSGVPKDVLLLNAQITQKAILNKIRIVNTNMIASQMYKNATGIIPFIGSLYIEYNQ